MEAKLCVILGSHACRTAMLMLEHKRIDYERVELPTAFHPFALRLRGFAGNPAPFRELDDRRHRMLGLADRFGTVPPLLADGQRVKTNRVIAPADFMIAPCLALLCYRRDLRPQIERRPAIHLVDRVLPELAPATV
jgi:hypothetical protein